MATNQSQETWFANVVGKSIDVDGAFGLQCKDVVDSYCQAMFGNWIDTIRPNNAKDCFDGCNPEYFDRIPQNWNDPNLQPIRGDIIVYGASPAVPEGHIAVVESANNEIVNVIQQDGYLQIPAHRKTLGYTLDNGAQCIGWLRPKFKEKDMTEDEVKLMFLAVEHTSANQADLKAWKGLSPYKYASEAIKGRRWLTQNHYITFFGSLDKKIKEQDKIIESINKSFNADQLQAVYDALGKVLGK